MSNLVYGLKSDPTIQIKSSDLTSFYEESIGQMGFKQSKDILNPTFLSRGRNSPLFNTMEAKSSNIAQFNQTGSGIPVNSTTVAVTDLLREIGTVMDIGSFYSHYIKDTLSEAVTVIVETINPIQGAQNPRKQGQPFTPVQKLGNQSASFTPGYWGDKIDVTEQDILYLREIGVNNFSIRGIAQYLSLWTEQLAVRAYTLKNLLLQQAIFQGQYSWYGQTFSFGVPSQNTLTPITGQPWATLQNGVYLTNQNAQPLTDIRYFISNNAALRRLKPFIKGVAMNRNTHTWFYENNEVQQLIQYGYMANPDIISKEPRGVTMEGMIEYFLGGDIKVGVIVDDSTYQADAYDPVGNAAGTVNYFIPDGKILFVYDFSSYGGDMVDYVYTPAIQNGGAYLDARPGLFMVMEDLTKAGTFGGYETPSIKLLCGSNSMPRVKRPNDLFVLSVI